MKLLLIAHVYAFNAMVGLMWRFDEIVSFAITFSVLYGLCISIEALLPIRLGRRPRVFIVPAIFLCSLVCHYLFMDRMVTALFNVYVLGCLPFDLPFSPLEPLFAIWSVGLSVSLFRVAKGVADIRCITRGLPDGPESSEFRAALVACGLSGRVTVKTGGNEFPVMSCGILWPCVIVPHDFSERYSPEERFSMYLHECVHIRNRDAAKLLAISLVRSLFWFAPVLGRALERMKKEMEFLCDWTVVHVHRVNPSEYASLVVKAASGNQALAAGFSGEYRTLTGRLGHILKDEGIFIPRGRQRAMHAILLAAICFFVAMTVASAAYRPPLPDDDNTQWHMATEIKTRAGIIAHFVFVVSVDP